MNIRQGILLAAATLLAAACGGDNNGTDPNNGNTTNPETELTTVTYRLNNDDIRNPERGLYTQMDRKEKFASLAEMRQMYNEGKTLVMLMYYLPEFRNKELPETFITKLGVDLESVRDARMKAILRFAYTDKENGEDAPMDIILRHLEQMKPMLHKHVGVIACVQAGFIGAWGEWYYSSHKLNNAEAYRQVLNKWLEVLPESRCIQVRTPKYKQDFVHNDTPLTLHTAFKNTPAARIGHHNDAFMADETNQGTYINIEKDKAYVAQEALYVPLGGEANEPAAGKKWATGAEAWAEVQRLHWSFLNDAYYKKLLDTWKVGGFFANMKKFLGYRLALQKAAFSKNNAPGSDVDLRLWFTNQGTAPMYNARPAFLILRPLNGVEDYVVNTNIDLRTIQPGNPVEIKLKLRLPAVLPKGQYKLLLWMPDADEKLQKMSEYAVQLANTTLYDRQWGDNDLNITLDVDNNKDAKPGTSPLVFVKLKR